MDTTTVTAIGVSVAVILVILLVAIWCSKCCRKQGKDGSKTSNQVDLHGMCRAEAVVTVKNELEKNKRAYKKGKGNRYLNIITGRGKHSPNGKPVLRPAIENYLHETGHKYHRGNPGMVRVDLGQ